MRLDESRIPKGGGVKVRCPQCNEIDYVEDPSLSKSRGKTPSPQPTSKIDIRTSPARERLPRANGAKGIASEPPEPSIPEDAFEGFRFPAEREENSSSKRSLSTWARILIWAIVSLAIVAIFALLVNIVLSGPAGNRPFIGGKSSGMMDRQSPPQ